MQSVPLRFLLPRASPSPSPPPSRNTHTPGWVSVWRSGMEPHIASCHLFWNQSRVCVCVCDVTVINSNNTIGWCIIHLQSPSATAKSCDCVVWEEERVVPPEEEEEEEKFEAKGMKSAVLLCRSPLPETTSVWNNQMNHVKQPLSASNRSALWNGRVKISQEVFWLYFNKHNLWLKQY